MPGKDAADRIDTRRRTGGVVGVGVLLAALVAVGGLPAGAAPHHVRHGHHSHHAHRTTIMVSPGEG